MKGEKGHLAIPSESLFLSGEDASKAASVVMLLFLPQVLILALERASRTE